MFSSIQPVSESLAIWHPSLLADCNAWTESQTALDKIGSHFNDYIQGETEIEGGLQQYDKAVGQRANEVTKTLKGIDYPDENSVSKNSCVQGLVCGILGSIVVKNPLPLFWGLSGCFLSANAQQMIGSEFQVNSFTTSYQDFPSVASFSNGNFVVAWKSNGQDGDLSGVYGQLFAGNSSKIGSEFQVNSYTTSDQQFPSVASFSNGNFVVAWHSDGQDGSFYGVYGQLFAGNSSKIGSEFQVNSYTTNLQWYPSVASFSNGNFVVSWESFGQDGSLYGVYGQLFAGNSSKIGSEFQVNSYTSSDQQFPSVASFSNGNFVVAWQSYGQDGDQDGVYGQLFAGNSSKIGSEFQVNSYTTSYQSGPSVASFSNGNFVVAWVSRYQDGSGDGVYGQLFAGNSSKIGREFQVNSYTTSYQWAPSVASFSNGNFVVTWVSDGQDGDLSGVYGQLFAGNSSKIGSEFQVNSYTTNTQGNPSVASFSNGNFVVSWESWDQDGDLYGVYGQLFYDNSRSLSSPSTSISSSTSNVISSTSSTKTSTSFTVPSFGSTSSTKTSTSSTVPSFSSLSSTTKAMTSSTLEETHPDRIDPKNRFFWIWFLLGGAGGILCLGLTSYFLRKKCQSKKDSSGDLEEKMVDLKKMDGQTPDPFLGTPQVDGREESSFIRKGKGRTEIGARYELVNKITLSEAETLFYQTGISVSFPEGKIRTKVDLGKGNFGKLRLAFDKEQEEFVGVKKIKGKEKIQQSKNEGKIQERLRGKPNIMPLLGYYETIDSEGNPVLYQFMPLAGFGNGNELKGKLGGLKDFPELQEKILIHVAQGLLTGLSAMHEKHIYHCDMRPGNMVFDRKGNPFIIDFGLSRALPDGRVMEMILSDTKYHAPEQWAFSRKIQGNYHPGRLSVAKAEAWALGVNLVELATGKYPFDRTDFSTRLEYWNDEYFQEKLDAIPGLKSPASGSLFAVVKGLLHVDPEKRLSIEEALSQVSRMKSFANEEEQAKAFAELKQVDVDFTESVELELSRDKDQDYMNVYIQNRSGFEILREYDVVQK